MHQGDRARVEGDGSGHEEAPTPRSLRRRSSTACLRASRCRRGSRGAPRRAPRRSEVLWAPSRCRTIVRGSPTSIHALLSCGVGVSRSRKTIACSPRGRSTAQGVRQSGRTETTPGKTAPHPVRRGVPARAGSSTPAGRAGRRGRHARATRGRRLSQNSSGGRECAEWERLWGQGTACQRRGPRGWRMHPPGSIPLAGPRRRVRARGGAPGRPAAPCCARARARGTPALLRAALRRRNRRKRCRPLIDAKHRFDRLRPRSSLAALGPGGHPVSHPLPGVVSLVATHRPTLRLLDAAGAVGTGFAADAHGAIAQGRGGAAFWRVQSPLAEAAPPLGHCRHTRSGAYSVAGSTTRRKRRLSKAFGSFGSKPCGATTLSA